MFGGATVALQAWKATVANLKKNLEIDRQLEGFLCVNSDFFGDREAAGELILGEQWLFSPKFGDGQPCWRCSKAICYYC